MGKPTHRGKRNHKKLNNLKILTINVRGIKSKLDSLEKTLHTLGTHIAGITETHLTRGETINIPGYEWRGKERNNKEGGGIGFLIRKDIINITEDIEDLNPQSETKWIKLKTKKQNQHGHHVWPTRKHTNKPNNNPVPRTNNKHKQKPSQ